MRSFYGDGTSLSTSVFKSKSFELLAGCQLGPWMFIKNFLEIGEVTTLAPWRVPLEELAPSQDLRTSRNEFVNCLCVVIVHI